MGDAITTQIYLRFAEAEPEADLSALDLPGVASVRIGPGWLGRTAETEAMRAACHARDLPLMIEGGYPEAIEGCRAAMADGVHLTDAPGIIERARTALGPDLIIGVQTGAERHAAMSAAEAGADYVAITPEWESPDAAPEFVRFWSEVIETPLVVENAASGEGIAALRGVADFVTIDPASPPVPLDRLAALLTK